MENSSNLTILISLLINGMFIIFSVLSLVYLLGKIIIRLCENYEIKKQNDFDVESVIERKVKEISNGKGKVISYKKI